MKISVVSDLHLEMGYQELPGNSDVLILSGDIAEARSILRDHHSTKLLSPQPNHDYPCSEFFFHECKKYEKVFYVLGNHEHYRGNVNQTLEILERIVPPNVTILDDSVVEYRGVMFLGGTLWTDINNGDPLTEYHLKNSLNDYRAITVNSSEAYYKLTPAYTHRMHARTLRYFKTVLDKNLDKPFVVCTHHAPTSKSINKKYAHDRLGNGGYVSNLDNFILDNPQIKFWTHGHVHDFCDYTVGDTRVVCNPRGYYGYENDTGFDPSFHFEI